MNGNLKHSKTRQWQAGYQQGHVKEVYPFVLTNWVRDKVDPRKEEIKLTHLDGHDKEHVGQVATRWVYVEIVWIMERLLNSVLGIATSLF